MSKTISMSLQSLESSVRLYALEPSIDEIPGTYYDSIMKTWKEMNLLNHNWDSHMAAAALVYAAVVDGFVHRSQMTPSGYRAFNWAETFMHRLQPVADEPRQQANAA